MLFPKIKKYFIFSVVLLCILMRTPCQAMEELDDLLNDEETENFLRDNTPTVSSLCDPKAISSALVDFGIIPVLQENFYLRTNELNNRSLLDYPIFLPRRWKNYTATYGFDIFWNKTNRMFFTNSSSAISSYLNIGPTALLDAVSNSFAQLSQFLPNLPFTPARIFPLFRNFTVEQRRIGAMFHAEKRFKKLFLYCFVPIYYIERNMFASEIEQEALTLVFGRLDQESQDVFAKKHLVSDKFGLGDTRLSIDFQLTDSQQFGFNLGFFTTLPTAFAFTKGIEGSTFEKTVCPKPIDILDLACKGTSQNQADKDAALQDVTNFAFSALDNLSAQLLETPLGNGGHVGLGFAFQTDSHLNNFIKRPWASALDFRSRISLEYLIPNTKTRSFLQKDRSCAFEALGLNDAQSLIRSNIQNDEAYATAVLNFFDQQITQELFPPAFKVRVHPGFIFRSTSKTFHENDNWYFALGNDFWLQSKEKLTHLESATCSNKSVCQINESAFNIRAAQKPVAYQGKVWGTVAYKVLRNDIDWILSLNVDETYLKSGIGADYTIALGFEAHF